MPTRRELTHLHKMSIRQEEKALRLDKKQLLELLSSKQDLSHRNDPDYLSEHLIEVVKDSSTPDRIKTYICAFFVKDRCFPVNGFVGDVCLEIALRNLRYVHIHRHNFIYRDQCSDNDHYYSNHK